MKERTLYHCEICGFESESKEEVLACETRGRYPAVKVGDIVQEFEESQNVGIVRATSNIGHRTIVLAARSKDEIKRLEKHIRPIGIAFIMGLHDELTKIEAIPENIVLVEPPEIPSTWGWNFGKPDNLMKE